MIRNLLSIAVTPIILSLFIPGSLMAQEPGITLEVIEFLLCEGVDDREPVNPKENFTTLDERVYAYARIHNTEEPVNLNFRWSHDGAVYANIYLLIGVSDSWRTYSSVQILAGEWKVELVGEDDEVLASAEFSVTGDG
ncbi:MAG: DUF2914 domain-containing protein [Rhodothermaceae bacterium]|nr:DUF2914 domain-containing protein [Rhodothermaceae bacterium]